MLILTVATADEYIIVEKEKQVSKRMSVSSQEDITQNIEVKKRFTSFNGFSADLTDEEYNKIKNNPNYIVEKSREFNAMLENSIPQVNADEVWPMLQNQTNITGTGQTVCIIDSGVNYSHPNLGGGYGNNIDFSYTVIGGYDFCANDDVGCTGEDADPMDVFGHGTHVTGIITSNDSTRKGVAPDTKIIMIKAMNATGRGTSSDLISGIEWCTNNKSKFNISVISMSLGDSSEENTYCDSLSTSVTTAIHNAITQNITVVISTGNTQTGNGISWPACTSGVIPVGSVHQDDSTINYQRGDLYQIIAPGGGEIPTTEYIYSTYQINEGFVGRKGTSMAAPHVAGAVAILNQFYNLQTGQNMTNATVKAALNQTRKWLDDTSDSGNFFPRLDVEWALYSIDLLNPNITLIEPQDTEINTSLNQTFTANITDFALRNVTFYLWNSSTIVNQTEQNISGQENQFQLTVLNLSIGEYNWTITAYDMNNNTFTAQNFTLTISSSTTINYPTNNSFTNQNETNFSCTSKTSTGTDLDNITISIWNSTGMLINNQTQNISGTENTTIFNYTLPSETEYTWNCQTYNNQSELTSSENYTLTYETITPNLTVITTNPSDQTASSYALSVSFNVSDNYNQTTCELFVNSASVNSSTITNYSTNPQEISYTVGTGTNAWKINCTDRAQNSNVSTEQSFTVTAPADDGGGSSGGGGGGGGSSEEIKGTENNPHNSTELKKGIQKFMRTKMKVYIKNEKNQTHSITLNQISNKTAQFTIESEPINISLKQGDAVKLNISGPEYYDLLIRAITITDTIATINITEINEPHPNYTPPAEREFHATDEEENIVKQPEYNIEPPYFLIIALSIIFVTLLIIVISIYTKKGKQNTQEIKIKKLKDLVNKEKNDKK